MSKYALVMIDMQNGFIDSASPLCIPMAAATVPACAEVITLCRTSGVPVVFATRHYRADGSDVEKCRHDVWLRGGKPLDYDVIVLSDCTSSMPEDVQRANLADMARIGARIMTADELKTLL